MSAALLLAAAAVLTTVAEESAFLRTGRYAEVERLCEQFPRQFPGKVRCDRFGTTPEGRPMLALVASADGTLSPEQVRAKKRPVLLAQGGIHAGELDGKDAGLLLLRDVLAGKTLPGVLGRTTFVFVPVFNVDGHERFGPNQRPNQIGPEETGWRVTAQNLNLNRDYAKADAPEMAAMLGLLAKWDPILYVDLHVTDGAQFEHDVAIILEPQDGFDEGMRPLGRALREGLFSRLSAQGHLPLPFYPSFRDEDDPASGFAHGIPSPRLQNGYWPTRNRFAALVETHSWRPYAHRVLTTRHVLESLLQQTADDGAKWLEAARQADARDAAEAKEPVAIAWKASEESRMIDFRGYAYVRELSGISGKPWIRYDPKTPQIWKLPLFDQLVPSMEVAPPRAGYVVPAGWAKIVGEKLALHGIAFEVLPQALSQAEVQAFRFAERKFATESYEGRIPVTVTGKWNAEKRDVPAGSLFVPANQRGRRLILQLLEPTARDSLVAWGFFNAAFERKEYVEDYVLEPAARELLARDPKLAEEFSRKLLEDPAFRASTEQRLLFFAKRLPSWDERVNLYPVLRSDRDPRRR